MRLKKIAVLLSSSIVTSDFVKSSISTENTSSHRIEA